MKKKLITKIIIFIFPYLILGGWIAYLVNAHGEIASEKEVIELQASGDEVLWGAAYMSTGRIYKLNAVLKRKPEVIALGNSRVMQFRDIFFNKNPSAFYNAGGGIGHLHEYYHFLKRIPPEQMPRVVIIGLDHHLFNMDWTSLGNFLTDALGVEIKRREKEGPTRLNRDLLVHDLTHLRIPYPVPDLSREQGLLKIDRLVGLMARVRLNGYRSDGSYCFGEFVFPEEHPQRAVTMKNLERVDLVMTSDPRFRIIESIPSPMMHSLKQLLTFAKENNIYLIGFTPPYAHDVYERYKKWDNYKAIHAIPSQLAYIFSQYNYPYFDFTSINSFGGNKEEVVDSLHLSEVAYLKIIMTMALRDKVMSNYVDINQLLNILNNNTSPYLIY